jgi:hypothetical protein
MPIRPGNRQSKLLQVLAMHHGIDTHLSSAHGARVSADFYYAWRFI